MNSNHHPYTAKYSGITNCIMSNVQVSTGLNLSNDKITAPNSKPYIAIWDTGATGSAITGKIVSDLDLKPIDITLVSTANGVVKSNVFLINVYLPNKTVFEIRPTESDLGENVDMLIGMEVITRGDFSITNRNGNTTFSFQVPSIEEIDLVQGTSRNLIPIDLKIAGRNDTCPCGSGVKFKKCHGQYD